MHVFLTGASGFVGSAVARELLAAGHTVTGLARSDASAAALTSAGIAVHRGSLDDRESLRAGAAASDGVIHCAFVHDFKDIAEAGRTDLRAVETFVAALAGSKRPLLVTSGTAVFGSGTVAVEDVAPSASSAGSHRVPSENATRAAGGIVIRLPPTVHGEGDHGFVPMIIQKARDTGVSAYIGDGAGRWPAVHRLDAAVLYRLAFERGEAGASYHAVAEEGVPTRQIAEVIGKRLGLPVAAKSRDEAVAHFGWLGHFFGGDVPASSVLTRERLGWRPTQAALIADLDQPHYFTLQS
jgi:nucleoside-diphosphate-sugar epimerase